MIRNLRNDVFDDMARCIRSMETYCNAMIDSYPHARGQGRLDLWAKAFTSYIDLIACEEKPQPRAKQDPTP